MVRLAFTPCLQYQYATGKNTADIALALDAQEAWFDQRAYTFCLVTGDSDFAHLSRKLRERGATVFIVGEARTPDALRNAADGFFEWTKPVQGPPACTTEALPKRRPLSLVDAVTRLAGDTGLLKMLRSYDRLAVAQEAAWRWTVKLAPPEHPPLAS